MRQIPIQEEMPVPRLLRLLTQLLLLLALISACSPIATSGATNATATAALPHPKSASSATSAKAGGVTELTVFAAASLTESFGVIARNFEAANPGTRVTYNFGGSNDLAAEIVKGAPVDVFASANQTQMDHLIGAGAVAPDAAHPFVRNRLVVIYPRSNPARIVTLKDLARPGVKIVLAAGEVPVGKYSRNFLDKASQDPAYGSDYRTAVLKNVVSNEQDVKAVLNKVVLGEADAGIVYATDVTPAAASKVVKLDIPDPLNSIATYPIAALKSAPHPALAGKFVDYVLSPEGQVVLEKFGFISANGAKADSGSGEGYTERVAHLLPNPVQSRRGPAGENPLRQGRASGPSGRESRRW